MASTTFLSEESFSYSLHLLPCGFQSNNILVIEEIGLGVGICETGL